MDSNQDAGSRFSLVRVGPKWRSKMNGKNRRYISLLLLSGGSPFTKKKRKKKRLLRDLA